MTLESEWGRQFFLYEHGFADTACLLEVERAMDRLKEYVGSCVASQSKKAQRARSQVGAITLNETECKIRECIDKHATGVRGKEIAKECHLEEQSVRVCLKKKSRLRQLGYRNIRERGYVPPAQGPM
jgi:hypothetical protein